MIEETIFEKASLSSFNVLSMAVNFGWQPMGGSQSKSSNLWKLGRIWDPLGFSFSLIVSTFDVQLWDDIVRNWNPPWNKTAMKNTDSNILLMSGKPFSWKTELHLRQIGIHTAPSRSDDGFLEATTMWKLFPPLRPTAGPTANMAVFESKMSSNDIINNDMISDDGVVPSFRRD